MKLGNACECICIVVVMYVYGLWCVNSCLWSFGLVNGLNNVNRHLTWHLNKLRYVKVGMKQRKPKWSRAVDDHSRIDQVEESCQHCHAHDHQLPGLVQAHHACDEGHDRLLAFLFPSFLFLQAHDRASMCVSVVPLAIPPMTMRRIWIPMLITPVTVGVTSAVDSPFLLSQPWLPRIGLLYPCHARDRERDSHHTSSHARDNPLGAVLSFLSFS